MTDCLAQHMLSMPSRALLLVPLFADVLYGLLSCSQGILHAKGPVAHATWV